MVTLARHDERAEKRFNAEVMAIDNIISADTVAGETDAILMIVARDVAELHVVLSPPVHARGRAAADHAAAAGRAQAVLTAAAAGNIRPVTPRELSATRAARRSARAWRSKLKPRPDDPWPTASTLSGPRSPPPRPPPPTPQDHADVILQLSTAAQQLLADPSR